MRPTQQLYSGPNWKVGQWLGHDFGAFGGAKQKGIITYGLAANRQNPVAGATHDAIFNTFRRTKSQIFYWLPVMAAGYYIMHWATERNEYLNSKAGRAEFEGAEE
ncbi:ubiquinol--cytochrome-c reductase subunit 8 [Lecanicillium sp. MT-2017a]|nr:ubiquinol--cytochrome-c reductase subunit 8 [Lecanicillium sp. MT-2017a]